MKKYEQNGTGINNKIFLSIFRLACVLMNTMETDDVCEEPLDFLEEATPVAPPSAPTLFNNRHGKLERF